MSLLAGWTMDMWSPIINLFSFIPNYGWMIIVFTIALKLILSPLDIWQKKVSRDSMRKQEKMQPQLDKLKKQYGNNQQLLNQKTMQLYKKEGYNVVGSCLSMFVNLALTIFIFFTLFSGLIEISQEKTYKQYETLELTYKEAYVTEMAKTDATITDYSKVNDAITALIPSKEAEARQALIDSGIEEPSAQQIYNKSYELVLTNDFSAYTLVAQEAVATKYEEIKDGWLWVDSIWRPDTYVSGVPNYNDFLGMANLNGRFAENETRVAEIATEYNIITANIQKTYSSWNGYFILVVLAGAVTFLSIWISQKSNSKKQKQQIQPVNNSVKQNQQQQQVNPNKAMGIMKFIMPIIMIIFTLSYSAAFALYIVTNSIMSVIISFVCMKIFDKLDKNRELKEKNTKKISYSR